MPKIKMNLAEYDGGFDPIPEGEYEAFVYEVKYKEFKGGASDGYAVQYKVADGTYKGRRIFDNIVLVKTAYFKVAQFYKAVTGESTGNVDVDTDEFKKYVGKKVKIKVGVEEYNGNEKNAIKNVEYIEGAAEGGTNLNDMLSERDPVGAVSDDGMPF